MTDPRLVRAWSLAAKVGSVLVADTRSVHPKLIAMNVVARLVPLTVGNSLRAQVMRAAGFRIGEGTLVRGTPRINGARGLYDHLTIGRHCFIDLECTLDLEEHITLGDRVTLGHQVMILTSTHELGPREHRAGPLTRAPVAIGDGAWLGPRCIVLPGVTIGAGAIVSAGALVNKNVAEHTRVGGTPAKVLETIEPQP